MSEVKEKSILVKTPIQIRMIIKNISKLRKIISSISNKIIYYVPTMGNLHEGHLQLIKYAQEKKAIFSCKYLCKSSSV